MTDHVHFAVTERVLTLRIDRVSKKNALTQAMYAKMAETLDTYAKDDDIRALVITGTDDVFTAGNDLGDFAAGPSTEGGEPPVSRFLNAISSCPKPIIASVNGLAIGVGLTMLLHCDLVYAGESALLSAPFVSLGLVPEAASSLLLPQAVGPAVANDIFLTGRRLTAQEAHDYGLVSRVFPDDALAEGVAEIAQNVAASSPTALKRSKALIRHELDHIRAHMATEGKAFGEQLRTPDFAESVAALKEKRRPNYS